MKRSTLLTCITVLSLLGLADAWYLADAALTGASLTCSIAGLSGCNIVAQSQYSHFLGQPLGLYGMVYYAFFLLISGYLYFKPSRKGTIVLAILSSLGLLASAYFVYIQFALIHALCIYCLGSAAISVLLWVSALSLTRSTAAPEIPLPTV